METVTKLNVGGIEYAALRQHGDPTLTVGWRSRVTRPGCWFACGQLIPDGRTVAVQGWDGEPIGHVHSVRDGLDALRSFYARIAVGSVGDDQ